MSPEKLDNHLQALFEGQLRGETLHALEEELRNNPEARDAYWEELLLHHSLRYRSKGTDITKVVPMDQVTSRMRRRAVWRSLAVAAVAMLIGAMVLILNMVDQNEPAITFKKSLGTQLSLTHAPGDAEIPKGLAMQPGSTLVIDHGMVELDFDTGVRSIVSGPASLTLVRDDLIRLDHGKAWFDVPSRAVGFQVITPDLVLTDLGTRFGIVSEPETEDQVHVFEGLVELLNRRSAKTKLELRKDEAILAEADGGWSPVPLDADAFMTKLPAVSHVPVQITDSANFTSSPNNQMIRGPYSFTAGSDLNGFSTAKADKLVVTLSHEGSSIEKVTFEGISLSLAVQSDYADRCRTAIYYLDDPPPTGNLEVIMKGNSNGVAGSLMALANTRRGKPHKVMTDTGGDATLPISIPYSLVVASLVVNDHEEFARPTAQKPLIELFGGPSGSSAGASGYKMISEPGEFTATFQAAGKTKAIAVAVFSPTN